MTLDEAIEVLCRIHTKEDIWSDEPGAWEIEWNPGSGHYDSAAHHQYVSAWETLIKHRREAQKRAAYMATLPPVHVPASHQTAETSQGPSHQHDEP